MTRASTVGQKQRVPISEREEGKTPIFRYTKQNKRRTSRNARSVTPSSSSSQGGDAAGDDDGTIIAIALVRVCVRTVSDNASARARFLL